MNNNIIILPIIIPMITAVLLIFFNKQEKVQKYLSAVSSVINIGISVFLVHYVHTNGIISLEVGDWKAPFGIVLVADMYAILLVLTANIIVFACLLFSYKIVDYNRSKFFYYSGVMFLLTGVSGAFLTGDLFNLFVFYEVMLMSSYFLIVHGNSKPQLRETIKYILVNVISSALFVISVAFLYAVTGTLNMADLSLRVAELGSSGIIAAISIMYLIVFGLKGAIFPLFLDARLLSGSASSCYGSIWCSFDKSWRLFDHKSVYAYFFAGHCIYSYVYRMAGGAYDHIWRYWRH